MNLAERAFATETVLQRYRDKAFDWAGPNCIRLSRAQASAMGHKVPPVPVFRSALGAKRALAKQGCETVTELLDKFFPRHFAPAFMLVGDLCVVDGEGGMDAVFISDGQGSLFGWHDAAPERMAVVKFAQADIRAAWRL